MNDIYIQKIDIRVSSNLKHFNFWSEVQRIEFGMLLYKYMV
jgi:hypothetical protein